VDVIVRDRQGRAVDALTPDDFQLYDEGVRQKVVDVSRESVPLDVRLVVDISGSTAAPFPLESRINSAVLEVSRVVQARDQLILLAFSTGIREVSSPHNLGRALPYAAHTDLIGGLLAAILRGALPNRRSLVIAVTDGVDTLDTTDRAILYDVIDRSDVTVYMVVVGDGHPAMYFGRTAGWTGYVRSLTEIATRAGGMLFDLNPGGNPAPVVRQVFEDFHRRHILHYVPQGVPNTGWHRLRVVLRNRDYSVQARRGYWAG
jgi:Mg-chelatase subunit ChlD